MFYACDVGPRRLTESEMRDVLASSTKCLRTAIHALGGIEVIFPLLTYLDCAVGPMPLSLDNTTSIISETPSSTKTIRMTTFFKLLSVLIADDTHHMERLICMKGSKILNMIIQQQHPSCLTMKSLDSIMLLEKVASETVVTSINGENYDFVAEIRVCFTTNNFIITFFLGVSCI